MLRRGGGLIGAGIQNLLAQLILHGRFQNHGHIIDRAEMVLVIQAHAIGEVGGV